MLWKYSGESKHCGGLYANGKIYLKGISKTIAYDIQTGTVQESEIPPSKYVWSIEDRGSRITIENTEQGETKTLTLEEMSKTNAYAQQLSGLSLHDDSRFFVKAKVVDDDVYIIGEVLNWWGEAFAVVFKYDFSTNQVFYVSAIKVEDGVSTNYSFVVCDS